MKKIKKITILIFLVLVNSCSEDEPTTPPHTKSNEANLLKLELEHEGTTYTTSISGTSITISNILPYGTEEVSIKTIEISEKATANKKAGDKLKISDSPVSIEVISENGETETYSLNLQDAIDQYGSITTESTKVNTYQAITISITNDLTLTEETYEGVFGDNSVVLNKITDNTLGLLIPNLSSGNYVFSCDLGRIDFEVEETVLVETVETTVNSIEEKIISLESSDPSYPLTTAKQSFSELLKNSTEQEKIDFALFYEANKKTFDDILNSQSSNEGGRICLECTDLNLKFGASVVIFGSGVWITVTSAGNLAQAFAGVTIAVYGWTNTKKLLTKITDSRLKIVANILKKIDDELNGGNIRGRGDAITFIKGESIVLGLELNARTLNISDKTDDNNNLINFFSSFDDFNEYILKLNSVIELVNELPFVNISLIETSEIAETSTEETEIIIKEIYNNYSFSIQDTRVSLTTEFIEEGKIKMTVSANESVDLTNPLDTKLIINYQDDFNNFTEEIEVTIENNNPYVGNWVLVSYNGLSFGENDLAFYIPQCNIYLSRYLLNSFNLSFSETEISLSLNGINNFRTVSGDGSGGYLCDTYNDVGTNTSHIYSFSQSYNYPGVNNSLIIPAIGSNNGDKPRIEIIQNNTNQLTLSYDYHSHSLVLIFQKQ